MPKKNAKISAKADNTKMEILYSSMVLTLNIKNHINTENISQNFPQGVSVRSITRVDFQYVTSDICRDYYPAIISMDIPKGIDGNDILNNLPQGTRIVDITVVSHIKQDGQILDLISHLGDNVPKF